MFFAPSKSRYKARIQKGVLKTSHHIKIKTKMPNPCQEHPASSKALNQDLKNIDVLCINKIKIENKVCNMTVPKTSAYIQIKIKIPNHSKETPYHPKPQIRTERT